MKAITRVGMQTEDVPYLGCLSYRETGTIYTYMQYTVDNIRIHGQTNREHIPAYVRLRRSPSLHGSVAEREGGSRDCK